MINNEDVTIKIMGDEIIYNGKLYKYVRETDEEFVGRTEIAKMAGFWTKRNGKKVPNTSNLYDTSYWAPIYFPNFEIEKAAKGAKPWKRREVRAWLNIDPSERKAMYIKYLKEKEDEE